MTTQSGPSTAGSSGKESQLAQSNPKSREKTIVATGVTGVIVNLLLVAFKGVIGMMTGSVAIVTDAYNNLTDALSSVITIVGAKLGAKAPDRGHPFGHGRIEYLSSILISVVILYTGVSALVSSIEKIVHPDDPHYDVAAVVIVAGAVVVKCLLGRYFIRMGKKTDSPALGASGVDALYDAAVSSSILVAVAVYQFSNVNLDGWLGALIAAFIIKSGIDVLLKSGNLLIGARVPSSESQALKSEIGGFPGVLGVYDLVLNRYGPEIAIGSAHIEVPDWMTAPEIDTLTRRISAAMYKRHGLLMTIGIYASNEGCPEAREIRQSLEELAAEYPEILQIHGFYLDQETKTVSFDVIVDFDSQNRRTVERDLQHCLRRAYPEYTFHTVLDRDVSD